MTNYLIVLCVVFSVFSFLMGYILGNSKRGNLVKYTNELPNGFLRVVSIDKVSSVLEEFNVNRKRFLVSTEVFGGKPIRPLDIVRKIKSDKERKNLEIPVLGYPPLVKDSLVETN